ncbi:unnamed protein product, partial [Urochloa humidicola]
PPHTSRAGRRHCHPPCCDAARLRKYGLRYDDLYDPYHDLDIKEPLDARNQRLKRARDLSMKHQYHP